MDRKPSPRHRARYGGTAHRTLPAYDCGYRDHMVGVCRVAHPQKETDRKQGKGGTQGGEKKLIMVWFESATKLLPRLRRVKLRHENHEWQFRVLQWTESTNLLDNAARPDRESHQDAH